MFLPRRRSLQALIRSSIRLDRPKNSHRTRRFRVSLEMLEDRVVPAISVAPIIDGPAVPSAEVTGDFDGNGKLDLAVSDELSGNVSVYLGNGDGTFQPRAVYAVGTNPDSLAVGDLNGDGKLDLVAGNLDHTLSILLGNGDGTFRPATTVALPSLASSVAIGDVNSDGHADIVTNSSLLLGNGDGTFQPPTALATFGNQVALGDLNADGKLDLVDLVQSSPVNSVVVSLGNGNGTFGTPTTYSLFAPPSTGSVGVVSMKLADLNGDGKLDLALSESISGVNLNGGNTSVGAVSVLLNNGDGTFGAPTDYLVGPVIPGPLTVGDFNGDGHLDLATANNPTDTVSVLLNNGDGTFHFEANYGAGRSTSQIAAGDFKGDGRADIVTANIRTTVGLPGTLNYLASNSDGSFPTSQQVDIPGITTMSQAFADFNGDGILDWAFISGTLSTLSGRGFGPTDGETSVNLALGRGDGTFGFPHDLNIGPFDLGLAVTDANGDGRPDLAVNTLASSPDVPPGTVMLAINTPDWSDVTSGAVGFRVSAPQQVTAGGPFSVTVSAIDASGNLVPGFHGDVDLDQTQAGSSVRTPATQYIFTPADAGQHTFTISSLTKVGTASLSVFAAGMSPASVPVNVTPGVGAGFAVTTPTTTPAGSPFTFTLTSVDAFGNPTPSYLGTVAFTSSDPQAILPASYTFTPADAGTHTFSATFKTEGSQSVSVADTVTGSIGGVGPGVLVIPLAATTLSVSLPSANPIFAGVAQPVTITARDQFGNIAFGYRGTVFLIGSDSRSDLPAFYTFTAVDAGAHTLSTTFKTAGPQSITVNDPSSTTIAGSRVDFTVSPNALATFAVTGFPATTAGVSQSFTVTAQDAFGNVITGYTGTVSFGSSDPQASLPAAYTFTLADSGVHTFSATLKTAGSQSLSVSDLFNTALAGTQAAIPVTAAAAASFTVAGFPATTAGVSQSFTVTARDAFGNIATGYTGTVSFSSSDAQAGLPASYTFTVADAGVHTFSATLKTAGTQSIAVQDTTAPTVAGTQAGITVTAAALARFALSVSTTPTVGKSFTITVEAVDAFGNVITGYLGKIHFTDSASNAGLPSDYTFSSKDAGVHTFSVTLNTAGAQTLTVTDTSNSSIVGSVIITVSSKTSGGGGH